MRSDRPTGLRRPPGFSPPPSKQLPPVERPHKPAFVEKLLVFLFVIGITCLYGYRFHTEKTLVKERQVLMDAIAKAEAEASGRDADSPLLLKKEGRPLGPVLAALSERPHGLQITKASFSANRLTLDLEAKSPDELSNGLRLLGGSPFGTPVVNTVAASGPGVAANVSLEIVQ